MERDFQGGDRQHLHEEAKSAEVHWAGAGAGGDVRFWVPSAEADPGSISKR